jgi:hypothetical protein
MASKPKNQFEEDKKRREHERNKYYRLLREKLVRRRTGLSRKNQQIKVNGLAMALTASPEIMRERWFKVPRGRKYHFALLRYNLRSEDGRHWTALQVQCHDADHGWMLSISGLYNLKPA